MSAPLLRLDLAAPRARGGARGWLLAAAGIACLVISVWQLRALGLERAGLEFRRDAATRALLHSAATERGNLPAQRAMRTVTELGTPWSQLLTELERASGDSHDGVALLAVEPDHDKHRIHIIAEARSLALALTYVERLRSTRVLRFPMLDSHELRTEDSNRPIRFQLSADWIDTS
jgi:hypothetical protein